MGRTKTPAKKMTKVNKKALQKKVISTFTIEELLEKAQDQINIFKYEEAQTYCQEALKKEPDNLRALETSASLCIETKNFDGAKHCLGRAITLFPENGFSKYLSMGQLLEGKHSLQCYLKGIELITKAIKESTKENKGPVNKVNAKSSNEITDESTKNSKEDETEKESDPLARKLSNAYCAVAELFMSDLCDEDEAEEESQTNIQKAITADPSNPEAYQHFANFLLIKQDFEKAKDNIKKSVSLWLPKYLEVEDGTACAGSFDPVVVCPLTQSTRFQSARILIEVEEYQLAADVLEGLMGEDDEVIYTWYLLGWNHYLQGAEHAVEAKQHFEQAMELHKESPTLDASIIEHMEELLVELKDVKDDAEDENGEDFEDLEDEEMEDMDTS